MPDPLTIHVKYQNVEVFKADLSGPVQVGRQSLETGEPLPFALVPGLPHGRLIIAPNEEAGQISRRHAFIEPLPLGGVRVKNTSQIPLTVTGHVPVAPSVDVELRAPFKVMIGGREIRVEPAGHLHSLDAKTAGLAGFAELSRRLHSLPALPQPQGDQLIHWLQIAMEVLQSTVGSPDFLQKAAHAMVEIVPLDHGRVLILKGDEWKTLAQDGNVPSDANWAPSRTVLNSVRREAKTWWLTADENPELNTPSLQRTGGVAIASPILDPDGEVIGALYGEKGEKPTPSSRVNGRLEAILVELLACGVATGLAREEQQKAALKARVRFEQFFGPELAQRLAQDPTLLEPKEAEVTLLFCDVRGFSRYSESRGPAITMEWMNAVMSALSECVLQEDGVLVDYVGDELFAMWGAPQGQPDQAERAVRAALGMLRSLEEIDAEWQEKLGGPTRLGIGINTGIAQVGNTGSTLKYKYGALGDPVNVASRVEGLTKYLKCPVLITQSTRDRLAAEFLCRRLCLARPVGVETAVNLFEVSGDTSKQRADFFAESEAALTALEANDYAMAVRKSGGLLMDQPDDGPLLLTLTRATTALVQDGEDFDPVWVPPGK